MNLVQAIASPWLVFTDLDGTLLDHHSYSATAAQSSLDRLRDAGIPVIFTSSKTYAELQLLMAQLGVDGPAITENGACIHIPADWVDAWADYRSADPEGDRAEEGNGSRLVRFSPTYSDIKVILGRLRRQHGYRFTGFADLDAAGVAAATGLSLEQARLARRREASEPLRWQDDETALTTFAEQVAGHGLKTLRGGRFWHILGAQADKAHALRRLRDQLRRLGWRGRTLALGDAPNDHGMLSAVDQPVLIRNPDAAPLPTVENPQLYRSSLPGPQGWREAIDRFIPKEQADE